MDRTLITLRSTYHIKLEESLDRSTFAWFGDVAITPQENGGTLLVGEFTDQSALRGFMDQLWDLNFTIEYMARIVKEHPG